MEERRRWGGGGEGGGRGGGRGEEEVRGEGIRGSNGRKRARRRVSEVEKGRDTHLTLNMIYASLGGRNSTWGYIPQKHWGMTSRSPVYSPVVPVSHGDKLNSLSKSHSTL